MAPAPVIPLTALTIGDPLTQIIAIGLRRRKRIAFDALAARMQTDPCVSRFDKNVVNVVRRTAERSRGGIGTLRTFLTLPFVAFRTAAMSGAGMSPEAIRYSDDIEHLWDQAVDREWAAWPITFAIVLPVAPCAWALGAGFARLRGAVRPNFPTLHDLARDGQHEGVRGLNCADFYQSAWMPTDGRPPCARRTTAAPPSRGQSAMSYHHRRLV